MCRPQAEDAGVGERETPSAAECLSAKLNSSLDAHKYKQSLTVDKGSVRMVAS